MSHNETHWSLIMRGNAGGAFLRTRYSLWSCLARILPLQERTRSCPRRTREVKPYAIRGPQAIVSSCPSKRCIGYWVSLLGESGLCAPRAGAYADFSVTASRSGAAPAGPRLRPSSSAGRPTARTPHWSYWLGGGNAIIEPG